MIEQLQPRGGTEKVFRIKAVMIRTCYSRTSRKRKRGTFILPPSSLPLKRLHHDSIRVKQKPRRRPVIRQDQLDLRCEKFALTDPIV